MKREGNRSRSEAIIVSNNIINTLVEWSNNLQDDFVEFVRNKVTTLLMLSTHKDIQQVLDNDKTIFNLIIRAIRRNTTSKVFNILEYEWKDFHSLEHTDILEQNNIKEKNQEDKDSWYNPNNLINNVITPIKKWILGINKNINNFITKKAFSFDAWKYSSVYNEWLKKIDSIINRLTHRAINPNDENKYEKVIKNAENDIVQAAKDPYHRAVAFIYDLISRKKLHTRSMTSNYFKENNADSLKRKLYNIENTSEKLSKFIWSFLKNCWYLNLTKDLSDKEKIF